MEVILLKSVYIFGFLIGFINSLLGAGGGMIAVPLLKRSSLSQGKHTQVPIAVILPLATYKRFDVFI